ncbi:MAG: Oxygen-independent coproporphyrinogen-III oxidase [Pseudomonadota bacterium]
MQPSIALTSINDFTDAATTKGVMWPYYPDLLSRQVPRYTSYPTAAEFHDEVGEAAMEGGLAKVEAGTGVSLYAHIPFCEKICWYCGCNTGATGPKQRLDSYLTALEKEIETVAGLLNGRAMVRRLAFGGGSPNAISPVDFVRLCDRIQTLLKPDYEELSIEVDPRNFNAEWAFTLAACGVTRVSMGVQSFSNHIQRAIGRIQPKELMAQGVADLRRAGIDAINFDLIYGLPGQTLADLEDTLTETLALRPSRIALFGYAHLPHMIPRQRRIDGSQLPGLHERFEMAALGYGYLTAAGYVPIGFDHFALPEDALAIAAAEQRVHRNFQGFTDDTHDILVGLGASAISLFPDRIVQNEKNNGLYRLRTHAGRPSASRGIFLTSDDRERARLIEGILCEGRSGPIAPELIAEVTPALKIFIERGLIDLGNAGIILTDRARPYARTIAASFDAFRSAQPRPASLAV